MPHGVDDRTVVEAFVRHLRDYGYAGLTIDRRPDEENRDASDIDAIAGKLAIEHSSVDTVENQRRDSSWFWQATGRVEGGLRARPSFRLSIVVPYAGIQKGQDWEGICQSLIDWIDNDARHLPDGRHSIHPPGISFKFSVVKSSGRPPGVFFARSEPQDPSLPSRLKEQLDRKARKLDTYKRQGYTTILLVESDDIALMNEGKMCEALRTGLGGSLPVGVDQIWYADTSIPPELLFYDFTAVVLE